MVKSGHCFAGITVRRDWTALPAFADLWKTAKGDFTKLMPPRLLIISRCSDPRGGADRIVADLCRHLPDYGWSVELGLTQGTQFNRPENFCELYPDIPFHTIDGTSGTRKRRLSAISGLIRSCQPDVVLSMRVFDAYEAVARCAGLDVPRLVVGIRAFEAPYLADARLYREVIDGWVTSGKMIAAACVRYADLDGDRVQSIAGGVHPPENPCSARVLNGRPVRLLYAGRIDDHQKRCHDILPFVRRLTEWKIPFELDVAGSGPYERQLRRQLQSEGGFQARFHGWVSRDELYRKLYPSADIFVHFAGWEGVTIAPREAMAHGVVPVISRFPGLEVEGQFVDGVNSLTFPVGDVHHAATLVQRLCSNTRLLTRLSANAAESQSGEYSFDGALAAWDAVLRDCMKRPKSRGHLPEIPEKLDGALTRLHLPAFVQDFLRAMLRRPVVHQSPGSEWPTSSGLLSESERLEIEALQRTILEHGLEDVRSLAVGVAK